jgi:hypothetical protein
MSGEQHQPKAVAIADGTRDAIICSACGVVRNGWVESGAWPCDFARCQCGHDGDVHFQDGCVAKAGGGYFCSCLAFDDGTLL